jgi:peptidoglycan hydrolase CwlO-like protein
MHFLRIENSNQKNLFIKLITKTQVIAGLVLFLIASPALALTQQEAQDQINQLNAQNQAASDQIKVLQGQKQTLSNELALIDAQVYQLQLKVNTAQAQIDLTTNQIDETNKEINQTEIDLKKQREIMSEYIRTMYMEGQKSTIELIAKSKSFSEFIDQSEYLSTVQQNVQDTANNIVSLQVSLNDKKKLLETEKTSAEQLKSETLSQKSLIDIQQDQKNSLLRETQGNESNYQSIIKSNNARMGVLHCIATGGCGSVANGNLIAINTPTYYNQTASPWGSYQYDSGCSDCTLSNYGCLITSLAMVHNIDPVSEARRHNYSNGFMLGGFGQNVTGNWAAINNALSEGRPVIVGLYLNSYGDTHFVVMKSTSDGKYYINDPYFGTGHSYASSQIFQAVIPY